VRKKVCRDKANYNAIFLTSGSEDLVSGRRHTNDGISVYLFHLTPHLPAGFALRKPLARQVSIKPVFYFNWRNGSCLAKNMLGQRFLIDLLANGSDKE
jgi:hypothetical protein